MSDLDPATAWALTRALSPARMLSRTHAHIDVDDTGLITVTDHHSGNGTETQTDPPVRLDPGLPYVIEPGTTLVMGDVLCTIDLRGVSPHFLKRIP